MNNATIERVRALRQQAAAMRARGHHEAAAEIDGRADRLEHGEEGRTRAALLAIL